MAEAYLADPSTPAELREQIRRRYLGRDPP